MSHIPCPRELRNGGAVRGGRSAAQRWGAQCSTPEALGLGQHGMLRLAHAIIVDSDEVVDMSNDRRPAQGSAGADTDICG